jgi:hypothetical protein
LGRLQHQYGEQHGNAAGDDQHYDWFGRRHDPVTPGDPGSGHSGAHDSVGARAGHQLEVIFRLL